ncbi:hypothetical protein IU459_30990 [Nocardia amamiensis]|uniref:Uncharacterized protein n=1 Tax=Nocardia amamiensis TaxID=404578 RepID=A0ABS0CZC1_9NOCA|nr:hypothetical protein [Nocardia amamiensis]MBF6301939.1 hypothetical protein [Nocardia amamiensis]
MAEVTDEFHTSVEELEKDLAAGSGPVRLDGGGLVISPLTAEDISTEAVTLVAEPLWMAGFGG